MTARSEFKILLAISAALVLVVGLSLVTASAHTDARSEGVTPPSKVRVISVADYETDGRTDTEAIQSAIDAAAPGDTVYFPGRTYKIGKPFFFATGVNYVGDTKTSAVLVGTGPTSLLIHYDAATPLRDATIQRLHFNNVEFKLSGDNSYTSFNNVTLKDCVFENGRRKAPWTSDFVWLKYTLGVTIDGCTFLRNAESGGRGVILERTRTTVIKDSYFGTSRDLEDGAPNGHFKTAINLTGYDESTRQGNEDVVVDGNVWRRTDSPTCSLGPAALCEDHGLYAWGVKDLVVTRNYGDGWTNTGSGGSVKLRNSSDAFITDNRFMGSGILAHTYWHTLPRHLSHVRISGNWIDLLGDHNPAMGILYWRSKDDSPSKVPLCQASGGERGIYVTHNDFVDGGSINVACANGPEVCVENNTGAGLNLVASVGRTQCDPPRSWDRPLAGVHRGDFNGDGKEDFVQQVRDVASGSLRWRAHLSSGDGFLDEDWGKGAAVAGDTEKYGVHVGDFNGDGLDDLAYRGLCGSPQRACWRVHRSTGDGFAAPLNYGNEGRYGNETVRFGLHPGDYNGDGRDDIAFRGRCGDDGHPCWTVLISQLDNTFAAMDWGAGEIQDSAETDDYGLLVGDFNGDGRDDIAYLGSCGSSKPCLRVQVSTGTNFVAQNWGGGFRPDGREAAHFGMRVGDLNKDGRTDIAYRGRCGSQAVDRWRYHLGAENPPFTTSCSTSFSF